MSGYNALAPRSFLPFVGRIPHVLKATGSTTYSGDGDIAAVLGTHSNEPPTAAVPWVGIRGTSGATSGNQAGTSGQPATYWAGKPLFQSVVLTAASIAVCRIYVGLANTAFATLLAGDTPGTSALSGAAFRYSTAVPDTNWQCVTFNGATQTVVDSGVPVAASTAYKFEISDDGTTTTFKINGNVVAQTTLTRPASTVIVRQGAAIQTLEAVAKVLSSAYLYTESD